MAYLISLYQWVFIAMRVNLYGGKFGMRAFRKRVKKSRLTTTVASSVIFLATLALIVLEVWYPFKQITQAVSMVEICEFSFLLLSFIITGSIIIRNLWVYFEKSYIRQRRSMLAALLLTIASLLALQARYILEFVYNGQSVEIGDDPQDPSDTRKAKISISMCLFVILLSDLLPIVTQVVCIWIALMGRWDSLMSGFLRK